MDCKNKIIDTWSGWLITRLGKDKRMNKMYVYLSMEACIDEYSRGGFTLPPNKDVYNELIRMRKVDSEFGCPKKLSEPYERGFLHGVEFVNKNQQRAEVSRELYLLKTNILKNPDICHEEKMSLANSILEIEMKLNK